jgi:hypothetical protein
MFDFAHMGPTVTSVRSFIKTWQTTGVQEISFAPFQIYQRQFFNALSDVPTSGLFDGPTAKAAFYGHKRGLNGLMNMLSQFALNDCAIWIMAGPFQTDGPIFIYDCNDIRTQMDSIVKLLPYKTYGN